MRWPLIEIIISQEPLERDTLKVDRPKTIFVFSVPTFSLPLMEKTSFFLARMEELLVTVDLPRLSSPASPCPPWTLPPQYCSWTGWLGEYKLSCMLMRVFSKVRSGPKWTNGPVILSYRGGTWSLAELFNLAWGDKLMLVIEYFIISHFLIIYSI